MYGFAGTKGFCAGMACDSGRPPSDTLLSCCCWCWMNCVFTGCSYCVIFVLWLGNRIDMLNETNTLTPHRD